MLAVKHAAAGERVGWFAPTHGQAMEGWRYLRYAVSMLPVEISEGERQIRFPGGGFTECRTTHDPDSLRGGAWGVAILDECRWMDRRIWPEIVRPALMDRSGTAIFISTPRGFDWFHEIYLLGQRDSSDWASWRFPSHDNPGLARSEIDAARANLPERTYRQEILAEFIADGAGVFRNIRAAATRRHEPGDDRYRYVAFYDTALGVDNNAVSVFRAHGNSFLQVHADSWGEVPYGIHQARISKLRQYPGTLYVDITGSNVHRHASVRAIASLVGPAVSVRGFTFTNANKEEMTDHMALLLESGRVELLDPEQCREPEVCAAAQTQITELESWVATKLPSGLTRYAAPPGMHDDSAVACMAALLASSQGSESGVLETWQRIGGAW